MHGLDKLREQGKMTWIDEEHGWLAAPEDMFITIDEESVNHCRILDLEPDPYTEDGGES
jgi:hypothetical protein